MQRRMADAILKAYNEYAKPNLADDVPDMAGVPLLVNFCLGDLRRLESTIKEVDEMSPHANRA